MYGLVELTQDYLKAEGEQSAGGEIFKMSLHAGAGGTRLVTVGGGEETSPPRESSMPT